MRKKLSSVSFWVFIFVAIIVIQAYSTFAQDRDTIDSWKTGSVGTSIRTE